MKKLRLQLKNLSILQISVFLLVFGLFFGVLCANIFKDTYVGQIQSYELNVFTKITNSKIDYPGLFRYILGKNFNEFFVYWLLCITILGIPYMAFKITSFGFFSGFFISVVTMQYGVKGIFLVLVYVFPQGLLYLPIALISLYKGYELCRAIYHDNHNHFGGIMRLVKSKVVLFLILAVVLLIASFLEAYPGAYLLKKALGLFV